METREFLAKVLSPADNYVLWLSKSKRTSWNENYATLDACAQAALNHDKNDETVYIAVGSFANNIGPHPRTGRDYTQRKAEQTTVFRAFAADLDVDPDNPAKYKDQREAVRTILSACDNLGLPRPMVVLSGNGVHVWWPLTEDISAKNWQRMSLALRAALESKGVKLDVSKISEPTMVLRPIGTHHKKDKSNWKPVRLVMDQPAHSVMDFAKVLKPFKVEARASLSKKARKKAKKQSAIVEAILDGGTPIILEDMHRCRQLGAILDSNGATDYAGNPVLEPMWRASLGIANYCEDKEAAAIAFSHGHPGYDEEKCLEKLSRWNGTGPTTCATFENNCPSGCEGCEHHGNITSPGQLTGGVTSIEVVTEVGDEGETISETKELPKGYSVKSNAIFYRHPVLDEEVFVSPYLMWVTARVTDADENTNQAMIDVMFPQVGVKTIGVDAATIAAGGNDLRKALADKQVYIKGDIDPLRGYLMSYLLELQARKAADVSYSHFGWQKDTSFLVGKDVLGARTETNVHLSGAARNYEDALTSKGSQRMWTSISRMFNIDGMEFQNFAVTLALAAPLMPYTNLPSALVNLYSHLSGSGKTLAGLFGLSAWGNPKLLMRTVKDTDMAFYKHFGTLSNFGGYVDELTTIDHDRLRNIVMTLQDGKERERITQSADGFRHVARWNMPVITSSNADLYEVLGARLYSEAEQVRVLQLPCPRIDFFEKQGTKIGYQFHRAIHENYGFAGPMLIGQIIALGGGEAVYTKALNRFEDKYDFTFLGQERFYMALCVIAEAAGKVAADSGIIGYDYERGIRAVLNEIERLRTRRAENSFDGFDTLFQFMTENQDEIVYWHELPSRSYALQPTPNKAVARVQVTMDDHDRVLSGTVFVNRTAFRKWCRKNGADYTATIDQMVSDGARVEPHMRVSLYKGVPGASASGQTHCFAVDMMTHNRLISAVDNTADSKVVTGRQRMEVVD